MKLRATIITAIALAIGLMVSATSSPVSADHSDGHTYDWGVGIIGLQQGLISGTAVTACSTDLPSSTSSAVSRWNSSSALGLSAFSVVGTCSSANTVVQFSGFNNCSSGAHMCTFPTSISGDPNYSINGPTHVYANPSLFGSGGSFPDGSTHASRDVTHEFGHVLGFADYSGCPSGATLMDTTETCWYDTPQTLDVNNYAAAYFADAVASLTGNSTSANRVTLNWNATNVHSEDFFAITRDGTVVATTAKNTQTWSSTSEPSGSHNYAVVSSH